MKLACFADTSAVPMRSPFAPARSMRRPAESPGGLVNTEPAFEPPGWFSLRHRMTSARRASPFPTSSTSSWSPAAATTCAGESTECRYSRSSSPTSMRLVVPSPRSTTSAHPRTAAMSDPCPPAFIRTAPPIEPGTPTAHSKPDRPACTVRRATTGRLAAPPATTTEPATSTPSNPSPSCRANPAKPRSATSRFDPRPTTATGTAVPASAAATDSSSERSCGRTYIAAAPPTR